MDLRPHEAALDQKELSHLGPCWDPVPVAFGLVRNGGFKRKNLYWNYLMISTLVVSKTRQCEQPICWPTRDVELLLSWSRKLDRTASQSSVPLTYKHETIRVKSTMGSHLELKVI